MEIDNEFGIKIIEKSQAKSHTHTRSHTHRFTVLGKYGNDMSKKPIDIEHRDANKADVMRA